MNKYATTLLLIITLLLICPAKVLSYSYDTQWYENPVRNHYYEIKSAEEYQGLVKLANVDMVLFTSDTISIQADLDLSSQQSINEFNGVLLGNNHTISNLSNTLISKLNTHGLIEGVILDATCNISAGPIVGALVSECRGTIKNCTNYANVEGVGDIPFVGGICGELSNGRVMGCTNYGNVEGRMVGNKLTVLRTGGICGQINNNSLVIGCCNMGNVEATAHAYINVGGITGDCQDASKIENCVNRGNVSSSVSTGSVSSSSVIQYTGGISGQAQGYSILDLCVNYGSITNNTKYVSGIIGHAGYASIYNCSNYGNVTSTQDFYFSCACGICSYFVGNSEGDRVEFLNCINTGVISSNSKYDIATAAGICNSIEYANVANLISFGSVSATALGSTSFEIQQYEMVGCNELSAPTSYDEANAFIDNYAGNRLLAYWQQDANGNVALSKLFSHNVEVYAGCAYVNCYPEYKDYSIKYASAGAESCQTFSSGIALENLNPDTEYQYEISDGTNVVNGVFRTNPINVTLTLSDVRFTSVNAAVVIDAKGIIPEEYGVKYRLTEEREWRYCKFDTPTTMLHNLKDSSVYDIKPYIVFRGVEYEGDFANFTTLELIPSLEQIDATSSTFTFKTLNIDDLCDYNYGITYDDKYFYADDLGVIVVDSLLYHSSYKLYSFIEKNADTVLYELGIFDNFIRFETCAPLQVSKHSAMVRVLADAGVFKNNYPYDSYGIEYRSIYAPDSVPSEVVSPILTDDKYEYCVTLNFDQEGMFQYRLKASTSKSYYSQYYHKYTEWMMVNTKDPTEQVVKPIFVNFKAQNNAETTTISCVNVVGEEPVLEYGIKYKIVGSEEYITLPLTNVDGVLSRSFTSLVGGIDYVGRFYNKTQDIIYYSDEFIFDNKATLKFDNVSDSISPIEEPLYLSIICPKDGVLKQEVECYQYINLDILPPLGWSVNSVFIDGCDVTSQLRDNKISIGPITHNCELAITYVGNVVECAESSYINSDVKVYSFANAIRVVNLPPKTSVSVFNIQGMNVYSGYDSEIPITAEGTYIVHIAGAAYKVYVTL